ncbi:MAG: energy transducer TonB, partial [Lautropia sp.]
TVATAASSMLAGLAVASDTTGASTVKRPQPDKPPKPDKPAGTAARTVKTPETAPAMMRPEGCGEPPAAGLDTPAAYRREMACLIHARNGAYLYDGAPPPALRSVVVLSIGVNPAGRLVRVRVLRSNGIRELERRAIQSVRSAMPLPAPGKPMITQGRTEITETWLFRDDGRFRVRSLASVQAASGY